MMTTQRILTIWDSPTVSRHKVSETKAEVTPETGRFLTIWDVPMPRRGVAKSNVRETRKLVRFFP